ncbi:D-ribose ABC transporter substrate-binding protein [Leuconostoc gasicomitatum]|uniref:Ribose ABC transport system, periplasmic ribose-binding protein RbsB (TC 3.A.1.2.1) n=2 Tax=Leuconostoc TaxID=1243 RepID=A0AAN2QT65_9LACO|nr:MULTISPECIES: D-ribose ABC transporter substrate-binding protein [Leuconostoc]MBZ5947105.1 D-ribose ABC transporter substrate-binding protein [Leuconostoc gasicomitatum]MBZ5956224.1 D-ribose ABC transporter substrate-binding protein [Leuconostoc gasicomitatum]MBZ5959366.1 D-ribose ABC transporter substrate-binding protein [Leuconostoc gasicomitatum]MBZ5959979.1 D-ribose ABC transporter substrate-binding protein [Leuconostoc gasicomitatum]MBZ5962297.1 D-ribose ABC transporter substrate-bindi
MTKKIIGIIAAIGILIYGIFFVTSGRQVFSISNPFQNNVTVQHKKPAELKIGVSLSTLNNPFFISIKDGVNEVAKSSGSKVQVYDGQNSTNKQSNDVEDLIQKKVDVLIINPVDSSAITPEVKSANEAGIPVITIDRSSDGGKVLSLVASDSREGGKMAAEFMIKTLGQNGKIAELQGTPGASATRERGAGFDNTAKGKLDTVTRQTANFDRTQGLNTAENIAQAHPEIKGLFAQNDEMALGAVQALKSNPNVIIVGFDGSEDGISSVKKGQMAATVAQKPKEMGKLAVQAAYDYFQGKKVSSNIKSPLELIVSDKYK